MRILFDQNAIGLLVPLSPCEAQDDGSAHRRYAACAPYQTLLDLLPAGALEALANRVVEAHCTYSFGEAGAVLAGNEGRLHRHIVALAPTNEPADIALSQLISTGPRAETDSVAIRTPAPGIDLARCTERRQVYQRL